MQVPRKALGWAGLFLGGLVVGGLVTGWWVERRLARFEAQYAPLPARYTPARNPGAGAAAPGTDFHTAAQAALPAVVAIVARSTGSANFFGLGDAESGPSRASGSGVVLTPAGHIATNYHVIEGGTQFTVVFSDNREYPATVVASDPNTDLAVLKVTAEEPLAAIAFGNSDAVPIGDWVLAIGNPFNLTNTVTAGIVSARARTIGILYARGGGGNYAIESFIQTDAAVNPGNSGGALVNLKGELIGINTAIATDNATFQGYSFAIPANLVQKVTSDLIRYGQVQRGFLGITIRDVSAAAVERFGLGTRRGAVVYDFAPTSAAKEAGLAVGDAIVAVNGVPVTSASELQEQVGTHSPGETLTLTYYRGGASRSAQIRLRNERGEAQLLAAGATPPPSPGAASAQRQALAQQLGAQFVEASPRQLEALGLGHGVAVVNVVPGEVADRAGIVNGTLLTAVGDEPLFTPQQLYERVRRAEGPLTVRGTLPDGTARTFVLGAE
ncbi:MAG: trypsin-like peptidase domain-containing protein [Bacteroidia bacterium]|nr:trypsin-like peptidase domain-containing protein [Bacteroidia bacterium]